MIKAGGGVADYSHKLWLCFEVSFLSCSAFLSHTPSFLTFCLLTSEVYLCVHTRTRAHTHRHAEHTLARSDTPFMLMHQTHGCTHECTSSHLYTLTHSHTHGACRGLLDGYCQGCDSMPGTAMVPVAMVTFLPMTSACRHSICLDVSCQDEESELVSKRALYYSVYAYVLLKSIFSRKHRFCFLCFRQNRHSIPKGCSIYIVSYFLQFSCGKTSVSTIGNGRFMTPVLCLLDFSSRQWCALWRNRSGTDF